MTYDEALEYLEHFTVFGINLGLERISRLLELADCPQCRFKSIHVTGTNGKGSTTAMMAAILQASGIKTGRYTSPHLFDYTERITVDGQAISRQAFADTIEHIGRLVIQMVKEGFEHPTEFEVLTAAAFHHFAASGVEYAVIEVGMGGLLDSTNVITPEVSIISNVAFDHMDRCGSSLEEIACHKAGIIKYGIPVITGAKGKPLEIILAKAAKERAPLSVLGKDFWCYALGRVGYQQIVTVSSISQGEVGIFNLNLLGHHQVENCGLAIMASLILAEKEARITLSGIKAGLASVFWPGRFEVVKGQPTLVIDGAHNPHGAKALREALNEMFPNKDITFLLGILADKDIDGITEVLVRDTDTVVIVQPLSTRAADPADVSRNLVAGRVEVAASIEEGLSMACKLASPRGVVCVAGSLYLVGPARSRIINK